MSKSTKLRIFRTAVLSIVVLNFSFRFNAAGTPLQLVSSPDAALGAPAAAGGDSYVSVISPDGRFVLFSSTARNLLTVGTNAAIPAVIPTPLNVFLRDRTNGSTVLISINANGTGGGNADSLPMGVSTNGRYALFESSASNLVAGDTNNTKDVFVRDVISGVTTLASTSANGGFPNSASYSSAMTPDGRYVAFASAADNIVSGDTNTIADVFLRDLTTNLTTLVSVGALNRAGLSAEVSSDAPLLSADGRYVAFRSTAANLVPGIGTLGNIYLRDMISGTTVCASADALSVLQSASTATNAISFSHALSADGRYIAFEATPYSLASPSPNVILRYDVQSTQTDVIETNAAPAPGGMYQDAQNLAMTPDGRFVAYVANMFDVTGTTSAIRLWDAQTSSNVLMSADNTNGVLAGALSDSPAIDESGRFVAFLSSATDLVTNDLQGDFHLYLHDLQSGTTTLLDVNTNGMGSLLDPDITLALSADGRFASFDSPDGSLLPLYRNHAYDVFVRDLLSASTEFISTADPNLPCLTTAGRSSITMSSVSSDARWIVFASEADDLTGNDTNGMSDIYVRDLLSGTNWLISLNTNGVAGDGISTDPAISADGRFAAFTSLADDLVSGSTNKSQVFVSALPQGAPDLVSVNVAGTGPGNGDSFSPVLSSNGQFVLFHSRASNLAPGIGLGTENLFWRDLQNNSTFALSTNGVGSASMTPDGHLVAFVTGSILNNQTTLYLWDSQSASIVYSQVNARFGSASISPNGQRVAYETNAGALKQLVVLDRTLNTNWAIASYPPSTHSVMRFSADGRFLSYVGSPTPSSVTTQIYLYDFQTQSNILASQSYDGSGPANGNSDSADLSSDGRFVAYRSASDNLVPGDTNGLPDIFLYDQLSGTTTLLTASRSDAVSGDNRSLPPVFSGDGRTVVFVSWASNLIPGDFNNVSDVFALNLYGGGQITPFAVTVSPVDVAASESWLNWPAVAGKSYRVQFKASLKDPTWQNVDGPISILDGRAGFRIGSALTGSGFYRVLAY